MNVTRKDATIENVGPDDAFPGEFHVVLSTPAKDRDGDELATEDWKTPLPDHITFDTDHGMSVASTVGSGKPYIDEKGRLLVDGTYSSLPRAQEARTLVREKHIRTVSVAFMSEKLTKDGKTRTVRELLNGAFVAIPSNREAVVLSAKSGARHSASDQAHLQAIYEAAVALGAGPADDTGAEMGAMGGKSYDVHVKAKYTAEQERAMLAEGHALRGPDGEPDYPIGDRADVEAAVHAVGRGAGSHDKIRAYIMRRARELDATDLIPADWKSYTKAVGDPPDDAGQLAQAVDAALDEAQKLLGTVDPTTLPEPVRQALGLITAAENAIDELLGVLGVADPDEDHDDASESAPAAAGKAAPVADADALVEMKNRLSLFNALAAAAD